MIYIKKAIILLFLLHQGQTFACNCKSFGSLESLRKISYEYSDIIFLGEMVNYDTSNLTYSFVIKDLFKGQFLSDTIEGNAFTSCSSFPNVSGSWIVYAKLDDRSNHIDISQCLASRSYQNPFCLGCYTPPIPLALDEVIDEAYLKRLKAERKLLIEKARQDWMDELKLLKDKAQNK